MSDPILRVCAGMRFFNPERFHEQICFMGAACPLCDALDAIRRTNDDVMELRKQIVELERKREVLGA